MATVLTHCIPLYCYILTYGPSPHISSPPAHRLGLSSFFPSWIHRASLLLLFSPHIPVCSFSFLLPANSRPTTSPSSPHHLHVPNRPSPTTPPRTSSSPIPGGPFRALGHFPSVLRSDFGTLKNLLRLSDLPFFYDSPVIRF